MRWAKWTRRRSRSPATRTRWCSPTPRSGTSCRRAGRSSWPSSKRQRSEREIEIEKKLRTPVSLQFTNAPLSKVLENLAKLAEVNLHLDPQGLAEEGVTSDTPVTIELRNEIMLKSALNLILEPLHLSYVIKDEVLKITSEQMRDGQVYTRDVQRGRPGGADSELRAHADGPGQRVPRRHGQRDALVGGGGMPFGSSTTTPLAVVASRDGKGSSAMLNPSMLAQVLHRPAQPDRSPVRRTCRLGTGPGGLGGGAQADFDSLIDLITSTVKPTTWDDVGGPGSIAPFETNLSIVVSQTQDVHEEIADLLEQLRRLQDLQVTIEVRFITLNDNFFERIGVSFDFDINSNIAGKGLARREPRRAARPTNARSERSQQRQPNGHRRPASPDDLFSADLDIPFTQNSYGLAVPQFGGFDATRRRISSASPSSATSRPTSSSTPPKATNAATCSRPPRSRSSTGSRRSSPTRRKARS